MYTTLKILGKRVIQTNHTERERKKKMVLPYAVHAYVAECA